MFPTTHLDAPLRLPNPRVPGIPSRSRHSILLVLSAAVLCGGLVWGGERWQTRLTETGTLFPLAPASQPASELQAMAVLLKLTAAALIGLLVTSVHRHAQRERP